MIFSKGRGGRTFFYKKEVGKGCREIRKSKSKIVTYPPASTILGEIVINEGAMFTLVPGIIYQGDADITAVFIPLVFGFFFHGK